MQMIMRKAMKTTANRVTMAQLLGRNGREEGAPSIPHRRRNEGAQPLADTHLSKVGRLCRRGRLLRSERRCSTNWYVWFFRSILHHASRPSLFTTRFFPSIVARTGRPKLVRSACLAAVPRSRRRLPSGDSEPDGFQYDRGNASRTVRKYTRDAGRSHHCVSQLLHLQQRGQRVLFLCHVSFPRLESSQRASVLPRVLINFILLSLLLAVTSGSNSTTSSTKSTMPGIEC